MLIYHWSESSKHGAPIDQFSAFAKYTRRNVTWRKIGCVVFFIFSLGILSGVTGNYLWTFFDDSVKSIKSDSTQGVPDITLDPEEQAIINPNEVKMKIAS